MDVNQTNTRNLILKITFLLTLLIVILDFQALYNSISHLKKYIESDKFNQKYFNECIKYQSIAEIIFGLFGSCAGISACVAGFFFIRNFDCFIEKGLKAFSYFNYLVFGPYLFACTFLGLHYFNKISYFCLEKENLDNKSLNLLIVFCIFLSLFISSFIISLFTPINIITYFHDSIRFNGTGSYILGKIFWKFVFERNRNMIIDTNNNNGGGNAVNHGLNFLDDFDRQLQFYAHI
jgi:hypothetical protein